MGTNVRISERCYGLLVKYISGIKDLDGDSYLFPAGTSKVRSDINRKHICRKSVNKFLERLSKKHPEFEGIHPKALQLGQSEFCETQDDSLFKGLFRRFKNVFGLEKQSGVVVGKSHLINCLVDRFKGRVLKLDDCYDIKKSLVNVLMFLYRGDKGALKEQLYPDYDFDGLYNHLQRDSMPNLCRQIIKAIRYGVNLGDNSSLGMACQGKGVNKNEYLLVIDSCDRITPRGVRILEELKDHLCILSSAREIPMNKSSFLWNFEIVRLGNLERRFALGMITHLSMGMRVEDKRLFRNHIFEQSVGNPRVISELIGRYGKKVVVTSDIVREVRHTGSLREYDCSFLVILFLGFLSTLRFMSHELGNDSLRFIGGCAVLLLLLVRNVISRRRRL